MQVDESITVAADADAVWRALTEPDERRRWWSYLDLDARPGGQLVERWADETGAEQVTRGEVLDVDPPRLLVLSWADHGWPAPTRVEVSVADAGGKGTAIRVVHSGWADAALADAHRQGWRMHLQNLAAHLARR